MIDGIVGGDAAHDTIKTPILSASRLAYHSDLKNQTPNSPLYGCVRGVYLLH